MKKLNLPTKEIIEKYINGLSIYNIAKEYRCSEERYFIIDI